MFPARLHVTRGVWSCVLLLLPRLMEQDPLRAAEPRDFCCGKCGSPIPRADGPAPPWHSQESPQVKKLLNQSFKISVSKGYIHADHTHSFISRKSLTYLSHFLETFSTGKRPQGISNDPVIFWRLQEEESVVFTLSLDWTHVLGTRSSFVTQLAAIHSLNPFLLWFCPFNPQSKHLVLQPSPACPNKHHSCDLTPNKHLKSIKLDFINLFLSLTLDFGY